MLVDIIYGYIDFLYKGIMGIFVVKVFDLIVVLIGVNEKILKWLNIFYEVVYV